MRKALHPAEVVDSDDRYTERSPVAPRPYELPFKLTFGVAAVIESGQRVFGGPLLKARGLFAEAFQKSQIALA